MKYAPASEEELQELLKRRPMSLRLFFRRYFMGEATESLYTKDELREKLEWDDDEIEINARRIDMIKLELDFNAEGLREQFQKVAPIIALFALIIAFNINGGAKSTTVDVVSVAAMIALWVQSPRFKIFLFRRRPDAGLRIGRIKSQLDEYHYYYCWVARREQTLHVGEVLVFIVTLVAVVALNYVAKAM
jgi:hypothetical protein